MPTINYHLDQIDKSGEPHLSDTIRKILTPSDKWHGELLIYNLDVVIAVGYRVNSYEATRFRIWTTQHKKNAPPHYRYIVLGRSLRMLLSLIDHYIMPPMPGLAIGISGLSSFLSQITHSVVRNMPATEAAFSRATRVTLAGSTTPAARKSPNSSVFAL